MTLLELVVAIVVLSIGTLAALRATDQSRRVLGAAPARILAHVVAENRIEEMRLLGASAAGRLPERVENGGLEFVVTVQTQATSGGLLRADITARSTQGAGAHIVAFLPPQGAGL